MTATSSSVSVAVSPSAEMSSEPTASYRRPMPVRTAAKPLTPSITAAPIATPKSQCRSPAETSSTLKLERAAVCATAPGLAERAFISGLFNVAARRRTPRFERAPARLTGPTQRRRRPYDQER